MNKDLTAASAVPLILSLLNEHEDYGYSLIRRVRECSGENLEWAEGMLYPILHRLEQQGSLAVRYAVAENGRRRKYYHITETGAAQLKKLREEWRMVNRTLESSWDT
ncbi:MAG: helix-turn-helix transcriptional regulator [Bacteroidetes bacterium]|nr:helix-turn-helix transcriptional regulator [Bacteroidota bacterium]